MKLHKSLVLTLLAAGSLIMGSAQAQEKLFTAQMGNRLDTSASLSGSLYPLGNQKETFGILIHTEQSASVLVTPPTDLDGDGYLDYYSYKNTNTVKLFSAGGTELKDLSSAIPAAPEVEDVSLDVRPCGNGSFVISVDGYRNSTKKRFNDYIFFSRVGTDWIETSRFNVDRSDKASIQDAGIPDNTPSPSGLLAFFRNDQASVVADVYTSDKAALTPAPDPQITSDLAILNLKIGKAMKPYATTANFPATGFLAFGLPPGLKINPATGQISGKPTTKGSFSVVIGALRSGDGPILVTKGIRVK